MSIHKTCITATFLVLLLTITASAKTTTKHSSSAKSSSHHASTHTTASASKHGSKHSSKMKTASARSHGQHVIGGDRTREIQSALIREHYLTGEPSGTWDAETKDAMMRYQSANGWQTKSMPDSRALIKLGLGPDRKNLLNPDTAVIANPHELGLAKEATPGGSASQ